MSDEAWEEILISAREAGLPKEIDTEKLRATIEAVLEGAFKLARISCLFIEAVSLAAKAIDEELAPIVESLLDIWEKLKVCIDQIYVTRPKLPRAPKRIDAPKARKHFDRRPQFHHARSTI